MLSKLIDRIRLPFRKEKELFSAIYAITGVYPKNIKYYKLALMHKSIMRKEKGKPLNNERLEYLGDAILDAVVGDIVFRRFEGKGEGFLTNARSKSECATHRTRVTLPSSGRTSFSRKSRRRAPT